MDKEKNLTQAAEAEAAAVEARKKQEMEDNPFLVFFKKRTTIRIGLKAVAPLSFTVYWIDPLKVTVTLEISSFKNKFFQRIQGRHEAGRHFRRSNPAGLRELNGNIKLLEVA